MSSPQSTPPPLHAVVAPGFDPAAAATTDEFLADPRTVEQLTLDTLVELVRIATNMDDSRAVLGSRRPVVQIHVTDRDLRDRRGLGYLDGQPDPVSITTIERHLCASGAVPIVFDHSGAVLNVGRDQRTFTTRQRIALAARDGGCRFPGCTRPASWTEAHHIIPWSHGGSTDITNGILLCQHHHLMIHNNGWQITRDHSAYFLIPPSTVDPARRRIPMPTKNRALQRALSTA